jgi:hypothetical protein
MISLDDYVNLLDRLQTLFFTAWLGAMAMKIAKRTIGI